MRTVTIATTITAKKFHRARPIMGDLNPLGVVTCANGIGARPNLRRLAMESVSV